MEEGVDFVDLARALIQPGPNDYQWSQNTSQRGFNDHSSMPGRTTTSSNAMSGVPGSNEPYFNQNSGLAPSHRAAPDTNIVTTVPSPTPNDRAAQLRAQLLATRKMTPETSKTGLTSDRTTSQNTSGISTNELYTRVSTSHPASGTAGVDDLLASISAATPSQNPARLTDSSATHDSSSNMGRHHNEVEDNNAAGYRNVNGHDSSAKQHKKRPGSSQQNAPWQGTEQTSPERRQSPNSNGIGAFERSRAEQDRIEREKAAAAHKAKMTRHNSGEKIKPAESLRKDHSDQSAENKPVVFQAHQPMVAEGGGSKLRPSLKTFDVTTVPAEVAQWLELHRFWDEPHRTKVLARENKRLELERQLRELDEEELEDGVRITRGPITLSTPGAAPERPRLVVQAAPKQEKVETGPSTPSTQKLDNSTKRTREEDQDISEPRAKAIKTEPRSLESRITRDVVPERPRTRGSPAPRARNGYKSYQPPPSRDRYDSYQGPAYGAGYGERERDRELEERERYSRFPFENEEKERAKKAQKKKNWSGVPCVPCRYYQQGSCHKGSTCTFLHE